MRKLNMRDCYLKMAAAVLCPIKVSFTKSWLQLTNHAFSFANKGRWENPAKAAGILKMAAPMRKSNVFKNVFDKISKVQNGRITPNFIIKTSKNHTPILGMLGKSLWLQIKSEQVINRPFYVYGKSRVWLFMCERTTPTVFIDDMSTVNIHWTRRVLLSRACWFLFSSRCKLTSIFPIII